MTVHLMRVKRLLSISSFPVLLLTVPGSGVIKQEVEEDGEKQNWDCKQVNTEEQYSSYFCEVLTCFTVIFSPFRMCHRQSPVKFLGPSEYFTGFKNQIQI